MCIRESEHPLNVTMDLTVHLEEMEFICNRRYNGVEGAEPIVLNNLYEIAFQRKTHFDMLIVCDKLDFKVSLPLPCAQRWVTFFFLSEWLFETS